MSKGFIRVNPQEIITLSLNALNAAEFAVSQYPDYDQNDHGFQAMTTPSIDHSGEVPTVDGFTLDGSSENTEPIISTKEQTELWTALVRFRSMFENIQFAAEKIAELRAMLLERVVEWPDPKPKPKGFWQ